MLIKCLACLGGSVFSFRARIVLNQGVDVLRLVKVSRPLTQLYALLGKHNTQHHGGTDG